MSARIRIHTRDGITETTVEVPVRAVDLRPLPGFPADLPCAGQGRCGKCRLRITGHLSVPDDAERRLLSPDALQQGIRLGCRVLILGDADLWPEDVLPETILTGFTLPALAASADAAGVGLALDLGTTTLAAYLYDMQMQRLLSVRAMPNPQRSFGADVTSRLQAAMEGQGTALRQVITAAIRQMTADALNDAHRSSEDLHHAVITGNTAMLYLLTGQEPTSIAFAPFVPVTQMGCEVHGDAVGLPPHTRVWLPECLSAYVGADVTCAMLYAAAQAAHASPPVLLADIGTNGEMVLFTGQRTLSCSTAAGPAFEGAGIRCGMTAQNGAIARVDVQDGALTYAVLGDIPARGICGSGLVDAIAALRELNVIDETGRMDMTGHPLAHCIGRLEGQIAFRFPSSDVWLTQEDIRTVQLAKSALCAGMLTLLDEAGLPCDEVHTLALAGGFGSCIRPASAEAIGLIPSGMARRTVPLGNAAGAGAAMMLLSSACKRQGAQIRAAQTSIELSTSAAFSAHFMDCMMLDPCGHEPPCQTHFS